MKGPTPKDPKIRQRTNKSATHAELDDPPADLKIPELPPRDEGEKWHPLTVAWWDDIWRSPMAPQFFAVDRHGLYMLAELVDRFWKDPTVQLAAEIRHQGTRFGLSPIDRRRLEWSLRERSGEKPAAEEKPKRQRSRKKDPRVLLFDHAKKRRSSA